VVGAVEVLRCMLAGRRVTAPDVAAGETQAKVHPGAPTLEAFFAAIGRLRGYWTNLVEVRTLHWWSF
jgi:hypothetical protein